MKLNQNVFTALAVALLAVTPAIASDKDDVLTVTQQFVDAGASGDIKALLAACTYVTAIIDEFPPYVWDGAGACEKWARDFGTYAKENRLTGGAVTLRPARHVELTGDHAYVVLPAGYTFKLKGKQVAEPSATWIVSMQKGPNGWHMTGFTWSKS